MKKSTIALVVLTVLSGCFAAQPPANPDPPLRVGVVGLVHDHVGGILGRAKDGKIEIVGIVETNLDLAQMCIPRWTTKPPSS